jgi:hypothetical protein
VLKSIFFLLLSWIFIGATLQSEIQGFTNLYKSSGDDFGVAFGELIGTTLVFILFVFVLYKAANSIIKDIKIVNKKVS